MTAQLLWSHEKEEKLRALWANGYSARLCAAELGVSRNAVIGKVHRMGLEARGRTPKVNRPRTPRKRRLHTPHVRDVFGKLIAPVEFVPRQVEVEMLNLSFDEVSERRLCMYPEGKNPPFDFCGQPRWRDSYCEAHYAVCWKPHTRISRQEFHRTRLERVRAFKAELVEA